MTEISDDQIKKELEFVMKIGVMMKDFMLTNVTANFSDNDTRARVIFNLMANFVANTMADISAPDRAKENIMRVVENIVEWVEGDAYKVHFQLDKLTNHVKKGALH